jgi:hypothetical protein
MPAELTIPFDRETTKQEIIERLKLCKRRPGDPKLRVELTDSNVPTPSPMCPQHELERKHQMRDYQGYVKVVVNSKEVSKTAIASLDAEFLLYFGETFPLKVASSPTSIAFQLWEHTHHGDLLVSEAHLPIPLSSTTRTSAEVASLEFSSDRVLRFDFFDSSRVSFSSLLLTAFYSSRPFYPLGVVS